MHRLTTSTAIVYGLKNMSSVVPDFQSSTTIKSEDQHKVLLSHFRHLLEMTERLIQLGVLQGMMVYLLRGCSLFRLLRCGGMGDFVFRSRDNVLDFSTCLRTVNGRFHLLHSGSCSCDLLRVLVYSSRGKLLCNTRLDSRNFCGDSDLRIRNFSILCSSGGCFLVLQQVGRGFGDTLWRLSCMLCRCVRHMIGRDGLCRRGRFLRYHWGRHR